MNALEGDEMNALHSETEQLIESASAIVFSEIEDETVPHAKDLIERAFFATGEACNSIQGQLDRLIATRFRDRNPDWRDWERRANAALRHKKWQRQLLQIKLGEANRRLKRMTSGLNRQLADKQEAETLRTKHHLFVRVAKAQLPKETFEELWRIVNEQQEAI
jgi:hypothetical protein